MKKNQNLYLTPETNLDRKPIIAGGCVRGIERADPGEDAGVLGREEPANAPHNGMEVEYCARRWLGAARFSKNAHQARNWIFRRPVVSAARLFHRRGTPKKK